MRHLTYVESRPTSVMMCPASVKRCPTPEMCCLMRRPAPSHGPRLATMLQQNVHSIQKNNARNVSQSHPSYTHHTHARHDIRSTPRRKKRTCSHTVRWSARPNSTWAPPTSKKHASQDYAPPPAPPPSLSRTFAFVVHPQHQGDIPAQHAQSSKCMHTTYPHSRHTHTRAGSRNIRGRQQHSNTSTPTLPHAHVRAYTSRMRASLDRRQTAV